MIGRTIDLATGEERQVIIGAEEEAMLLEKSNNYNMQRATELLKKTALDELCKTDITILRCYEKAVAVPKEWQQYRDELRDIVSGTSAAIALPKKPEYPAGT
jgi:hypothetical protein